MRAMQECLLFGEQQAGEVDLHHPAGVAQAQPAIAGCGG
jgi:hypothetical protein